MKARLLEGKTIRKVHQVYLPVDHLAARSGGWVVEAVEFTDGTFMRFQTVETEGDYEHEIIYPARAPEGKAAQR